MNELIQIGPISPLGHAKLNTTAFYTQVATKTVRSIVSPLDRLALASPSEKAPDG